MADLQKLIAYHRAEAAKFHCKEADDSERYGSKYIVGVADWHGKLLPAVLNTETGLTSAPMSRTLAQRRCCSLNYHEIMRAEGAFTNVECDDARLLRQLHGVSDAR